MPARDVGEDSAGSLSGNRSLLPFIVTVRIVVCPVSMGTGTAGAMPRITPTPENGAVLCRFTAAAQSSAGRPNGATAARDARQAEEKLQ